MQDLEGQDGGGLLDDETENLLYEIETLTAAALRETAQAGRQEDSQALMNHYTLFSPFIFIKNKCNFMSSEGFSTLEKNALICYQRAMLPFKSGVIVLLQIVMAVLRPCCLKWNFLGRA